MAIEIAKLYAAVGIDTKNFDQGINGLKSKLGNLNSGLSSAMGGFGGLAAAAGVGAVAGLVSANLEMAKASATAETLRMSFNQLAAAAGQSGSTMLSSMRSASQGLIADTELVKAANRAMLLGVADNAEEMSSLLEVARVRGRAMGLDLTTAFDNIVTGIGRMSPLILDNLGIVVNQEQANKAYAASLGKTAQALTDAEQKQALLNAVIAQSADMVAAAGSALTDAEKIQSMAAATQNLSESWGSLVLSMGVPDLYAAIAQSMGDLAVGIQAMKDGAGSDAELQAFNAQLENSRTRIHELTMSLGEQGGVFDWYKKGQIEVERASIAATKALIEESKAVDTLAVGLPPPIDEMERLKGTQAGIADSGAATEAALAAMGIKIEDAGNKATVAAAKMKELQAVQDAIVAGSSSIGSGLARAAAGVAGLVGDATAKQILDQQLGVLKQRTSEMRLNQVQGEELIYQQARLAEELGKPFAAIQENQKATEKWAKQVPQITEEFSNLQSTVQSAVSAAFGGDIGVDLEKILPRTDAVNEDARRLADIAVKGWESPWVDYFKNEQPALWAEAFAGTVDGGDIKAQAGEILKQFQAGLRPELLDRDMLKDQIRQAILGQQAMKEIVDQISKELSEELGIAMTEIKGVAGSVAGTGLGTGGAEGGVGLPIVPTLDTTAVKDQLSIETPILGTTMGQGVQSGMNDYVTEENLGAATSKQVADQMQKQAGDFKTPGERAGEQWGMAFLERVGNNVPQQLIDMLINLISPGLKTANANAETQTSPEGGPQ